jgi:hypothetical protein
MFCTDCGTPNKDDAKFCVKCGGSLGEVKRGERPATIVQPAGIPSAEPLFFRGIWIVIKSFFSLPYGFVTDTFAVIKKIGKERNIPFESSDVPFLNWLLTTGRVIITLISFVIIFIAFIIGIAALISGGGRYSDRNIISSFFGMIFIWILGIIGAFIQIWVSALCLELVSLTVLLVNNTKRITNLLEKSEPKSNS